MKFIFACGVPNFFLLQIFKNIFILYTESKVMNPNSDTVTEIIFLEN